MRSSRISLKEKGTVEMKFLRNKPKLMGFLLGISLSACAAAVAIGPGCRAYAEQRLTLPWEALERAPREVIEWLNLTDARMTGVCTDG